MLKFLNKYQVILFLFIYHHNTFQRNAIWKIKLNSIIENSKYSLRRVMCIDNSVSKFRKKNIYQKQNNLICYVDFKKNQNVASIYM